MPLTLDFTFFRIVTNEDFAGEGIGRVAAGSTWGVEVHLVLGTKQSSVALPAQVQHVHGDNFLVVVYRGGPPHPCSGSVSPPPDTEIMDMKEAVRLL